MCNGRSPRVLTLPQCKRKHKGFGRKCPPRKYETFVMYKVSLWASSPIWASEPSFSSRVRTARASTFHDSPQMESLFAGEYRIGLFSLSWILQSSQEKSKTMVMPNFGGGKQGAWNGKYIGRRSAKPRGTRAEARVKNKKLLFFRSPRVALRREGRPLAVFFFAKDNEFIMKIYEKIPQNNCCLVNIGKAFFWH